MGDRIWRHHGVTHAEADLVRTARAGDLKGLAAAIALGATAVAKNQALLSAVADCPVLEVMPIVQLLIANGADVNAASNNDIGDRPLHIAACDDGKVHIVKLLLASGVDVNARDRRRQNALFMAVAGKAEKCVSLLLDAGIDVYSGAKPNQYSPVKLAEALDPSGQGEILRMLRTRAAEHSGRSCKSYGSTTITTGETPRR